MRAYQVCQNFFHDALAPFHKHRQKALLDASIALINGASLTLYARCDGHFYLHKKESKGRKHKHSRCRIRRKSQVRDGRSAAKEPWLIFSSTDGFRPREIMKLYSHRMQTEQSFRAAYRLQPFSGKNAGTEPAGDTEHNSAVAYWLSR